MGRPGVPGAPSSTHRDPHPERPAISAERCLETYLREINEVPVLTADEERALGRQVQDGNLAAREHLIRAKTGKAHAGTQATLGNS